MRKVHDAKSTNGTELGGKKMQEVWHDQRSGQKTKCEFIWGPRLLFKDQAMKQPVNLALRGFAGVS